MTDSSNVPTKIVEIENIDTIMFRLRLAGKSCRQIARELRVPESRVREKIEAQLSPITSTLKAEMLRLDLERLDQYLNGQHDQAISGNRDALGACLRIIELRSDLAGTRAPSHVRVDPIQLQLQAEPKLTSTEKIRRALQLVRQPPSAALTYGGTAANDAAANNAPAPAPGNDAAGAANAPHAQENAPAPAELGAGDPHPD